MSIGHLFNSQGRNLLLGIALSLGTASLSLAVIAPDVRNTRHNLSASNAITAAPGSSFGTTVKATSETQICVFCHTPHNATSGAGPGVVAPLWNRTLSTQTYTPYLSSSMDADPLPSPNPGVGSKLCLSCHDGTLAIGTVGVLNNAPGNIAMQGTGASGVMPDSTTADTGYTRKIGVDLTNDHPISFTYDAAQAARDGELYTPGTLDSTGNVAVGSRVPGQPKPRFPLVGPLGGQGNQVECITCHDPHLKTDAVDPVTGEPVDNKFLRGNRFQAGTPQDGVFNPATDIMCLACHNKPTWAISTHANVVATSEQFKDSAADLRDFPRNTQVWQAACLGCHDVHTVPGSRRLLREGTDSITSPKTGGNPAIEQTCFQCHSPAAERALVQDSPDQVPDIKTDFNLPYHMPIVADEQGDVPNSNPPLGGFPVSGGGGTPFNPTSPGEIHDIGKPAISAIDTTYPTSNVGRGKDMMETRSQLGAGIGAENLINRHVECTDCHQPHRVTRTDLFNGDPTITAPSGTHRHAGSSDPGGVPHNNLASGVLRGAFGVEPIYSSNSFYSNPISFDEKRGPVTIGASTSVTNTYVTREYQVCAKCHSNYAMPNARPSLGRPGGTPYGVNGMQIYTNVFREIQAPVAHQGNATPGDSGVAPAYLSYNRRSWHPVLGPTGRTPALRGATATNWLPPWTNDVGNLTMYCTDCHGSNTPAGVSNQIMDGPPEGPHGSTNIFILKGWWDNCTGYNMNVASCESGPNAANVGSANYPPNATLPVPVFRTDSSSNDGDLCFKCHDHNAYPGNSGLSGFGQGSDNLHGYHANIAGANGPLRCMQCHIAVPHGWKNKAFLVNLNDVGPEAICRAEDTANGAVCTVGLPMPIGTQVHNGAPAANYTNPPYYRNAMLKITVFAPSGGWAQFNCGSAGPPGNSSSGQSWMDGGEGCVNTP